MEKGKRGSVRLSKMDRFYLGLVVEEDEDAMNDPSPVNKSSHYVERTKGKKSSESVNYGGVNHNIYRTIILK